jgi:hypothetical protein
MSRDGVDMRGLLLDAVLALLDVFGFIVLLLLWPFIMMNPTHPTYS